MVKDISISDIEFIQRVLIRLIQFSISTDFINALLDIKTVIY